ncbi:MAG: MOSC domain-containing protein [Bacteroidota bacterium]|nr:MOSC domain-containing protein [Bacteroidota bacterium]
MKVLSLNIGTPKEIEWLGKKITTSIFKKPVLGKHKVKFLTIEGDKQSDKKHHGGFDKAVYSYSIEYYDYWKKIIGREDWDPGLFGENLTTQNLKDDDAKIGNIYKIGTAMIMPVQPRFPCQTLCARFGMKEMIDKFYNSKRNGTYFRVIEEGYIEQGDEIDLIEESKYNVTIKDVVECKVTKGEDQTKLNQILEVPFIPNALKESFRMYLKN